MRRYLPPGENAGLAVVDREAVTDRAAGGTGRRQRDLMGD
jgi:hypothetical protein